MQCKEAREHLLLSSERDLAGDEQPELAVHLRDCAECRRFAAAMRHWSGTSGAATAGLGFVAGGGALPATTLSPELTERVLASVRPLPPPWVYHNVTHNRRGIHLLWFIVGALAVVLAFVIVSLALILVFASKGAGGIASHTTMETMITEDLHHWFLTIPDDPAHGAITVAAVVLFTAVLSRWSHALALRVGHDRHA